MIDLFIFDNFHPNYKDSILKFNITDNKIDINFENYKIYIDPSVLRNGSSTLVLYNPVQKELYTLFNFKQLLEVLNMTPSELLERLVQFGIMQIDKCNDNYFIKLFSPTYNLQSDTHDITKYTFLTKDAIHPIDWKYSWITNTLDAKLIDGYLYVDLELEQSEFWTNEIYASHGGQPLKLNKGINHLRFKYIQSEDIYIGNMNCRYKGRRIEVVKLLK